jgi:predicted HicB family RNase H-like nuclease
MVRSERVDVLVNLRVRREERREFQKAAKAAGMSFSAWARKALLAATGSDEID